LAVVSRAKRQALEAPSAAKRENAECHMPFEFEIRMRRMRMQNCVPKSKKQEASAGDVRVVKQLLSA
jgi:hypothetical protein